MLNTPAAMDALKRGAVITPETERLLLSQPPILADDHKQDPQKQSHDH